MTRESIVHEQTAVKFSLKWAGEGQAFLVASVRSSADAVQAAGDAYTHIAETLSEYHLEIVHERIFGPAGAAVYRLGPFGTAAKNLKEWGLMEKRRGTEVESFFGWF
jgi:hypothetical protein